MCCSREYPYMYLPVERNIFKTSTPLEIPTKHPTKYFCVTVPLNPPGYGRNVDIFWNCTICIGEVKMAGYWPIFFFYVFMVQDGVKVCKLAKTERGQYKAILTKQAWSIKGLVSGLWRNISCRSPILLAQLANHIAGFDSSCPLTELAI